MEFAQSVKIYLEDLVVAWEAIERRRQAA